MVGDDDLERRDVEALLATRRELGVAYDAALVDSFADRVERAVAERSRAAAEASRRENDLARAAGNRQLALAIVSLVAAVPISIPLGVTEHYLALLLAWVGIVCLNVAHAFQSRPRR